MLRSAAPRPTAVAPRLLADVAAMTAAAAPVDRAATPVTGITLDSRAVRPGDIYAALPGRHTHGAHFAEAAAVSGAVAVLTDPAGAEESAGAGLPVVVVPDPRGVLGDLAAWIYGEPARDLTMLGVTGTNGKTTTAYLLDGALRAAGHRTGLVGTIETRVGDETLASARTTPEAPELQALLAVMRERGCTAVTMEVSSHALAQGRVDGTTYDIAAFTNLSQDHLDFHPTFEDYYRAKASLFTPQRARLGVIVVDDDYGRRLAAEASVPVVTVSATGGDGSGADWVVADLAHRPGGSSRFRALGPGGDEVAVELGIAGDFNVANALLAVATLRLLGVAPADIARGIATVAVPGRMEQVGSGLPFAALVDYAHTPDAVERAIASLRPGLRGRVLVVLGCGGDRDRAKRPLMGEVAARGADVLVVTDDNPRTEDPAAIRAAMLTGVAGVPPGERAQVHERGDRRVAIALAVGLAAADDVVLVLGKGHETGQEIAGDVHRFDDRDVLRAAIAERVTSR